MFLVILAPMGRAASRSSRGTGRRGTVATVLGVVSAALAGFGFAGEENVAAARGVVAPRSAAPVQADAAGGKPRVLVLSDIGNEPDDQMSLVRFLVYSNEFDVEGLVATTSTWQKTAVRPDIMHRVIDAYGEVQPNLLKHAKGFPTALELKRLVRSGPPEYGMAAVGDRGISPGAELILQAADRSDTRPLWITVWGGANTLAQALRHAGATRSPAALEELVSRLRVYSISDQDDAGPWIRREFPSLLYVVSPSTPDGAQYYFATWTGISGDQYYRNAPGASFRTVTNEWLEANVRSKGPLGAAYPKYLFIMEGDTPSFLNLIGNGLAGHLDPSWGGWGGRYVHRQSYGETRPIWTQGGDAYPGRGNSRDTVTGADGKVYTSDQATIWRWREAFQHDFAARMDWTIKDVNEVNHNPVVVLNGRHGNEPVMVDTEVGRPVTLDPAGTSDPDGDALRFTWFSYPEAGSGVPGQSIAGVTLENDGQDSVKVTPTSPGVAHVVLAVEDAGSPSLTSYRRILVNVQPAPPR